LARRTRRVFQSKNIVQTGFWLGGFPRLRLSDAFLLYKICVHCRGAPVPAVLLCSCICIVTKWRLSRLRLSVIVPQNFVVYFQCRGEISTRYSGPIGSIEFHQSRKARFSHENPPLSSRYRRLLQHEDLLVLISS